MTSIWTRIGEDIKALRTSVAGLSDADANDVDSVNGHVGIVVLDADDVGAYPADTAVTELALKADLVAGKVPLTQLSAATSLAQGIVELATTSETITGTDTVRAVTPAGARAIVDAALSDLRAGVDPAWDTLLELRAGMVSDETAASALVTLVGAMRTLTDPTFVTSLTASTNAQITAFWTPVDNGDGTITLPTGLTADNGDGTLTIGV